MASTSKRYAEEPDFPNKQKKADFAKLDAAAKAADAQPTTEIVTFQQVTRAAIARFDGNARLFNSTDLAHVTGSPENIEFAVNAVRYITGEAKALLRFSVLQRGMYLCWLKNQYGEHGAWEKFCADRFPDIPARTRQVWMAAYLIESGERKPKELPHYDPDELDDEDLAGAIESLSTNKGDIAPRKAIVEHLARLKKQIEKGQAQAAERDAEIEKLQEDLRKARIAEAIPASVIDEGDRLMTIRAKFGEFLLLWCRSLPDDLDTLRMHKGLHGELMEQLSDMWETDMLPNGLKLREAHEKLAKQRNG